MSDTAYIARRGEIETYFDRTAADAWAKLTSDAPVSGVRATVRAGRDAMRETLLSWLPQDLTGRRILDAGCGAGQLAIEAARRGGVVTAVDLSPTLLDLARERIADLSLPGTVDFIAGDMLDPAFGDFDHIVGMDSIIHYEPADAAAAIARLTHRASSSVIVTFAPRTPLLSLMHAAGKLFPRADRSPAIVPATERQLTKLMDQRGAAGAPGRSRRVNSGFYISQAMERVIR
ncbi:MAG: magnesium protoporphyrin IX methyltransferase [Pseudomonadota bacterium]